MLSQQTLGLVVRGPELAPFNKSPVPMVGISEGPGWWGTQEKNPRVPPPREGAVGRELGAGEPSEVFLAMSS